MFKTKLTEPSLLCPNHHQRLRKFKVESAKSGRGPALAWRLLAAARPKGTEHWAGHFSRVTGPRKPSPQGPGHSRLAPSQLNRPLKQEQPGGREQRALKQEGPILCSEGFAPSLSTGEGPLYPGAACSGRVGLAQAQQPLPCLRHPLPGPRNAQAILSGREQCKG